VVFFFVVARHGPCMGGLAWELEISDLGQISLSLWRKGQNRRMFC